MTSEEGAIAVIILASIVILFFLMTVMGDFIYSSSSSRNRSGFRVRPVKKVDKPVIGYKRAVMIHAGETSKGSEMRGVVGHLYSLKDVSSDSYAGFHMYRQITNALHHPQEGNVFLEVVGYGEIEESTLGYETTKQRVTQILVGRCNANCSRPAVKFFSAWEPGGRGHWLCEGCSVKMSVATHADNVICWVKGEALSSTSQTYKEVEDRLTAQYGYRIAVRSVYDLQGGTKRTKSKHTIPTYTPMTELLATTNQEVKTG